MINFTQRPKNGATDATKDDRENKKNLFVLLQINLVNLTLDNKKDSTTARAGDGPFSMVGHPANYEITGEKVNLRRVMEAWMILRSERVEYPINLTQQQRLHDLWGGQSRVCVKR